jgi:hypothetical protein
MTIHIDPGASTAPMLHLKLAQTVAFGADALRDLHPDEMERLERSLQTLDSMCREAFQDSMRQVYEVLADKLERGDRLNDQEVAAVELLFTGEARFYLKTENNFDDWIVELHRLMDELRTAGKNELANVADLMHVQALCRDAMHVLPEVLYYLREKHRVELFRENIGGRVGRDSGRMLARMIRDLMASPAR